MVLFKMLMIFVPVGAVVRVMLASPRLPEDEVFPPLDDPNLEWFSPLLVLPPDLSDEDLAASTAAPI